MSDVGPQRLAISEALVALAYLSRHDDAALSAVETQLSSAVDELQWSSRYLAMISPLEGP